MRNLSLWDESQANNPEEESECEREWERRREKPE